uniref:hypothetical protein n=1 Tax=Salmonella sp. s51228 TaxID=3159652 RepID=UPI0039815C88
PVSIRKEDYSPPQLTSGRQKSTKKRGQKKILLLPSPLTPPRHSNSIQTSQLDAYYQSTHQRSPKLAQSMSDFSHSFPQISVNA